LTGIPAAAYNREIQQAGVIVLPHVVFNIFFGVGFLIAQSKGNKKASPCEGGLADS
jgi:hypothetical protein